METVFSEDEVSPTIPNLMQQETWLKIKIKESTSDIASIEILNGFFLLFFISNIVLSTTEDL